MNNDNLIDINEVSELTCLPPATVRNKSYADSNCFDPTFPKPLKLSKRCLRWYESRVRDWLDSKDPDKNAALTSSNQEVGR